ncbi:FecR family protein [Sphingobacterium sp. SYP-B4668]|uniref:FecR family protein n=1 Tax=Sphingobacterium sp. SYP-B4668 TaxID=2996035 RepID=UPI0022DDFEE4|nr:FecR family protein [Sphingobacterium sp. SYP-B4668]
MDKSDFLKMLTKKLTTGLSRQEQVDYDIYLQQHSDYNQVEQIIQQYYTNTFSAEEPSAQQRHLEDIWLKLDSPTLTTQKPNPPLIKSRWMALFGVAAACCLILGIGYYLLQGSKPLNPVDQILSESIVSTNQKLLVPMIDGSVVTLDPDSRLDYNEAFGVEKRQAKLSGSAHFNVMSNADIPLHIQVADYLVTVKGTSFYIREDKANDGYELILFHGKVELATRHEPAKVRKIRPNQSVRWGKDTQDIAQLIITDLDSQVIIQKQERLQDSIVFQKQKFEDLVIKLSDIYKVKFIIENEQLRKKRFSGMIRKVPLQELMHILETAYPFEYKIQDSIVIIR